MTEQAVNKVEALPDLDDLLQCPVCYEIPTGQIFQCNEGHHVCGRCKMRLDVCPVCRAFFFGTRNYAMEELISNVKKLRAFKLGGKVTTDTPPAVATPDVAESSSEENESSHENVIVEDNASSRASIRTPAMCKGLFRCLCCKNNPERLPLGRLLNHLRYYHSPDLIEGRSENGAYVQAWQFPTTPGRMVTAVRVHDMGIFFLVIEITHESVHAWMSMAASPWAAQEFSYSFTLCGNDREAIFSDCVWSVRSCEGSLRTRGHCLCVGGADARALLLPAAMSGKLCVRRAPEDQAPQAAQPRAVLRVANRSAAPAPDRDVAHDLEPFLQDLQNDVARLSRAFATLGREANALVRSEAEMRARLEATPDRPAAPDRSAEPAPPHEDPERHMSRNARRRLRQRLREAFRESQASERAPTAAPALSAPATRPAPPAAAAARLEQAPVAAPRSAPDPSRPNLVQVARAPVRPASTPNATRAPRVTARPPLSAGAGRGSGPGAASAAEPVRPPPSASAGRGSWPGAARAGGAPPASAPEPAALASTLLRAVSPHTFGGPSQNPPANGNTRNKKKRRQRR